MDPMSSANIRPPASAKRHRRASLTSIDALGDDALCVIFAFLNLVHLIRCSAVCKSWRTVISKLKLLQIQYHKLQQADSASVSDLSNYSEKLINIQMEQLAMDQQRSSLQEGPVRVFQWKAHSVGFNKCRMKRGLILTGVGDKVVGLVGTRICIWRRFGTRDLFSSREGLFTRGLCMCYVDPQAVVGCEDGKVRVFDMYSKKISQIIKMHPGAVSSLCFSDEQLIVSGSSLGSISISDLSSDQRVVSFDATSSAGIKTLCLSPSSYSLFCGSSTGYASCWDLRTMRRRWETRVSPNVLYSMHHLRSDASTLVVGGIDGVLRIVDQGSGNVLSRCIMENSSISSRSTDKNKVIEKKKAIRLTEDDRIDLLPNRPPITCLAVGMQKVVTAQSDKCIRVWKFGNK
ncbi:F-box/WD-40 repeat-containing protein At3g52030 isoform X2 [Salvia miltiorrhiza]|uniref:F-box/WD-40 repeat-containing protein At3g52030 isoform X2 n=1 Tax=Salvia miltiorrhiza TaxID=226208 RepID=UPI0025ACB5F4|nr:F-box/WD-40 repeat-containing protein At3g52030 isoform X2 [Salvia miltiorrhiza]